MKTPKRKTIELDMDKLEELLRRAETAMNEEDYATVKALVESYAYLTDLFATANLASGGLGAAISYPPKAGSNTGSH